MLVPVHAATAQACRTDTVPLPLQIDDVLGQAYDVSRGLNDQGKVFDSSGLKLQNLTSRFPAVNGLLNSIKRRKNRVRTSQTHGQASAWQSVKERHAVPAQVQILAQALVQACACASMCKCVGHVTSCNN